MTRREYIPVGSKATSMSLTVTASTSLHRLHSAEKKEWQKYIY